MGAMNGHKVLAELTSYGESMRNRKGKLWRLSDISMTRDRYSLDCDGFGIEPEFPEKVLNQAVRVEKM